MTEDEKEVKSKIIGPLSFANEAANEQYIGIPTASFTKKESDVQCLFCDKISKFYAEKDEYLAHLYLEHRLIIGDEEDVALLDEYLIYWRKKFDGDAKKLPEFCTTMCMDQLPDGTPAKAEKYYLLCDVLPEDNELRRNLYVKRLETVLAQHQFERTDTTFKRNCLYCRDVICGYRADFLEHLFSKHFLQLGKPGNLVFIDELIEYVQETMTALICLFCEKKFRDRSTLKEHMRKKGHKRINPDNKSYDKFFLINYRNEKQNDDGGGRRKSKQKFKSSTQTKPHATSKFKNKYEKSSVRQEDVESSVFQTDNSDSDWSDWEGDQPVLICLFCSLKDTNFSKLKTHMSEEHWVDFDKLTSEFTFYDRVKIVNFIRRQMHLMKCIKCEEEFSNADDFQWHLYEKQHFDIGDRKEWDLPQYFFPTYEDDAFLCSLDDTDLDENGCILNRTAVIVHSEDTKVCINADAEALSKEQLLDFHK